MSCKSLGEFAVLFSSRYIFGNCEIVNFQTAIFPAARIKCSRSERVINPFPFFRTENSGKRRRLTQAAGTLPGVGNDRGNLCPWPIEKRLPFFQCWRKFILIPGTPAVENLFHPSEQRTILLYFCRRQTVHGKAARIEDPMLQCSGRECLNWRLKPCNGTQARRPASGAIAAHALGSRLRFSRGRPADPGSWRFGHLFIVTGYDKQDNLDRANPKSFLIFSRSHVHPDISSGITLIGSAR